MKKFISVVLMLTLIASCNCGCGKKNTVPEFTEKVDVERTKSEVVTEDVAPPAEEELVDEDDFPHPDTSNDPEPGPVEFSDYFSDNLIPEDNFKMVITTGDDYQFSMTVAKRGEDMSSTINIEAGDITSTSELYSVDDDVYVHVISSGTDEGDIDKWYHSVGGEDSSISDASEGYTSNLNSLNSGEVESCEYVGRTDECMIFDVTLKDGNVMQCYLNSEKNCLEAIVCTDDSGNTMWYNLYEVSGADFTIPVGLTDVEEIDVMSATMTWMAPMFLMLGGASE